MITEKVTDREKRHPVGGTTVHSACAKVRNTEVHGRGSKPVGHGEDDHVNPGTYRMEGAMVAGPPAHDPVPGRNLRRLPQRARPGEQPARL